ncbi:aminoacetone oxidase family FAD-binding enzyme [Methanobacterium petrolearium]|uniref:aminoacetone oxidase family FAD-binding enzyme n=1 Tax=Methanobacterium petrolearium TaxID=710190 RepID=UPI003081892C|nr:hypothetical protein GCM10025861_18410 [Methanobacterium petrolearium]
MKIYDIAVIGAGPAGCMAAIQGAQQGKNVILLEKNDQIGYKLSLTANRRCNLTNTATMDVFLEKFGRRGSFYRDAFSKFSNQDLMNFFKTHDLELTEEQEGRIFPITEKARSVVEVLEKVLNEEKVKLISNFRLKHLNKISHVFKLASTKGELVNAYKVIIATGGVTYGFTGSTGDGLTIAKFLGHNITDLKPGGVPLLVREEWIHQLKGVTLENVGLTIRHSGKKIDLPRGNLLLTHFGVSGPIILDMSHVIVGLMEKHGDLKLYIDFKPEIRKDALGIMLMEDFQEHPKKV